MIYCWGSNPEGNFGAGIEGDSSVPIETENLPLKSIVAGSRFTFGISEDGSLYATGANESGQLGLGTYKSIKRFTLVPLDFKVKQVACGWAHSLILSEGNRVFVCGDGKKGQLGNSDGLQSSKIFTEIKINEKEQVIQVACGLISCFAVTESGKVLFWGQFRTLQTGICWHPSALDFVGKVSKVAVGHKHVLTLSFDGKVSGFGCNKYNQIPKIGQNENVLDIFAGWNHSVIKLTKNELILVGKNDHNQLAHPEKTCHTNRFLFEDEEIVDLAVGSDHALLLTEKRLLVWGWNEHGILGQNHTNQIYGPAQELNFDINRIEKIFCGPVSCFIITK